MVSFSFYSDCCKIFSEPDARRHNTCDPQHYVKTLITKEAINKRKNQENQAKKVERKVSKASDNEEVVAVNDKWPGWKKSIRKILKKVSKYS